LGLEITYKEEKTLKQQKVMGKMARAYELQEILKKERLQVKLHDEEYQHLMKQITDSKVQRLGKYEVINKEVQKKRQIISDKFRAKWPDLFNRLATVTMKAAREEIQEEDLKDVCEIKTVIKPAIMIHNEPQEGPQTI
jgi:ribonucleotide reductase beta subunit family protein with ferritin-like domain